MSPQSQRSADVAAARGLAVRAPMADARDASDHRAVSDDLRVRSEEWAARWWSAFKDGTQAQYKRTWASMVAISEMTGRWPMEWRRLDVDAWTTALREVGNPAVPQPRPLRPATIRAHMAGASSFYEYCLQSEAPGLARNPVPRGGRWRPAISDETSHQYLAPRQVEAILVKAIDHSPAAAALVAMLATCGIRVTEALTADILSVGEDGGHKVVTVVRKGGKEVRVPIPPATWLLVEKAIGGRSEGPIVATRNGTPMDRKSAWELVDRLAARAGVGGKVSPHTFRHAAITRALEKGVPLADVQDFAGHVDPKTTQLYNRKRNRLDRSPAYMLAGEYIPAGEDVAQG